VLTASGYARAARLWMAPGRKNTGRRRLAELRQQLLNPHGERLTLGTRLSLAPLLLAPVSCSDFWLDRL
jgi:hypothetical protein